MSIRSRTMQPMRLWHSLSKHKALPRPTGQFTHAPAAYRLRCLQSNHHPCSTPSSLQTKTTNTPTSPTAPTLLSHRHRVMSPSADHRAENQHQYQSSAIAADGMSSFAFAFDIDGVLLRSSGIIPGAAEALALLHNNNIPFILLTNGGGKHESARVAELSKKLGVPLTEENFVQSHTPFKQLVEGNETIESLKDKTILVTGGDSDKCRKVAEMYGFTNVVTPGDILMEYPTIWPFNQIFSDYYRKSTRPLPRAVDHNNPSRSLKIDAIFVFNDPRDWALDSQIIIDLMLSKEGILGTYSDKNGDASLPNNGWQQDGQPALFFSNPDVWWATSYHLPRLGQGGFQASLQGIWDATTGGATLSRTVIGKPYPHTYGYAERVLNKHRAQMLGGHGETKRHVSKLQRVFMVGDNPESDIRGANEYESPHGTEWTSVLVKTGVFRAGSQPKYMPKAIVDDVLAAVKWALKEEGWGSVE